MRRAGTAEEMIANLGPAWITEYFLTANTRRHGQARRDPHVRLGDPGGSLALLPLQAQATFRSVTVVVNGRDDFTLEKLPAGRRSCSAATSGRGEAGHPAHDPRCPPDHHLHGPVRAAHRGPTVGGPH